MGLLAANRLESRKKTVCLGDEASMEKLGKWSSDRYLLHTKYVVI